MSDTINISGLNKAKVLRLLFNASKQQGLGFLHADGAIPMTEPESEEIIRECAGRLSFDYLKGRVMKVDITGDDLIPYLYDRDNGTGAAERALDQLTSKLGK